MLSRSALAVAFVSLSFAGLTGLRASTVTITSPANNTTFLTQAKFDANGSYTNQVTLQYVYLQVYDTDLTTVICAENAVSNTTAKTWTNPVDANNESLLHAPMVGLGQTKAFKMTAKLYEGTTPTNTVTASRNLQVKYPVP